MGEQQPAFMSACRKRLESRVRSKFRHQLTSSSPSCEDWLRRLIRRPTLGALSRMKKTKKKDCLQRWVNRIWQSQARRSQVNEITITENVTDAWMFQDGVQNVLPGCRINFGKNKTNAPVKFLNNPVAAGPAPMTAAAISLEHILSLRGRRQRYKLIRESLGLEMPAWNWLHWQVQIHRPTGDPMDWQQWADVEARVLAAHPLKSRDVVVICLRAIACTKLCGGGADCFGSMESLPPVKVEFPACVSRDPEVKMEKFPCAVGLATHSTSDSQFIKIESEDESWTQGGANGLGFGSTQQTKKENSVPPGPSRIVQDKSADTKTRTIRTPVNSSKPKRLLNPVPVSPSAGDHTSQTDIRMISPTPDAVIVGHDLTLGEQMLRQHASANITDWWVFNRSHSTNNPRNQSRIPTLPFPAAAISRPLHAGGPPSNFHQLVSFYTCAPFLPLPRGNTFVNGWVSSQYQVIQIHDHILLTKFIDLLRNAHGITREVDIRVIQIAVGTSTFFFNLSDPARSELEWTMVVGLLLLGNEQVAHVAVGAQLNDLACPLG